MPELKKKKKNKTNALLSKRVLSWKEIHKNKDTRYKKQRNSNPKK